MVIAMDISLRITSSKRRFQLTHFTSFLLLFLFTSVSSSNSAPSYTDHCSSIVHESPIIHDNTTLPRIGIPNGHYIGGDKILGSNSYQSFDNQKFFSFRTTRKVYGTEATNIYKIQAFLIFRSSYSYVQQSSNYSQSSVSEYLPPRHPLKFLLNGFWSESSGKLCMVGSASWYPREGNTQKLHVVLELIYTKNATILNGLVSGRLDSLSSSRV